MASRSLRDYALPAACAAAFLLTVFVFSPCVHHEWLHWDDQENFILNERFRGLTPQHVWWMLTTLHMGPYQPLSWLTLGIDYTLWGMDPRGYHLTNVLLHALNSALTVWVTAMLFGAWARRSASATLPTVWIAAGALAAGLIWADHPQRVESVAWVTERRDVLSGLFFLLCVGFYLRGHEPGLDSRTADRRSLISQVCCLLALMSKATAVSLPVVLLALDVFPLGRLGGPVQTWIRTPLRSVLTEKLNYILFAALTVAVGFVGQQRGGALQPLSEVGLLDRVGLAAHSIMFYLCKLIAPTDLSPMYPRPPSSEMLSGRFLISILGLITISGVLLVLRRRWPAGLTAWVCYGAAVLPVSGLLTIGNELAADRYSYLASMVVAIAGGGMLIWLLTHWPSVELRAGLAIVTGIAFVVYAASARSYMPVWHDSVSLWEYAVQVYPSSARAQTNLGGSYALGGRYDMAIKSLDTAVALDPSAYKAHYNRGRVLLDLGRPTEALESFARAIAIRPNYLWAHEYRGDALLKMGRVDEAIGSLNEALKIDPNSISVRLRLAEAWGKKRDFPKAVAAYESLLASNRQLPEAYAGLVEVYLLENKPDRADQVWHSAPTPLRGHPDMLYALGRIRSRQNRLSESLEALQPVLTMIPRLRIESRRDSLLDNVRKDPRFDRMLAGIEVDASIRRRGAQGQGSPGPR